MQSTPIALVVALLACAAACTTPSLSPLYDPDEANAIFEEDYLGTWITDDGESQFVVEPLGRHAYLVTCRGEADSEPVALEAHVVELALDKDSTHRVIDLWPAESERQSLASRYLSMVLPTHAAMPCRWEVRDGVRVLALGVQKPMDDPCRTGSNDPKLRAVRAVLVGKGDAQALLGTPEELRRYYAACLAQNHWDFSVVLRREP